MGEANIRVRGSGEPLGMPKVRVLETSVWVRAGVREVFPFFADAANLNALTPSWLDFRILTPQPIAMGCGTLIDYRIGLKGVPMRWRTLISAWEPPVGGADGVERARFVDTQLKGPYALWVHEHTFRAEGSGTRCDDRVEYAHWGGPIGERLLVRPDLDRIFAYRKQRMLEIFGGGAGGSGAGGAPEALREREPVRHAAHARQDGSGGGPAGASGSVALRTTS